MTRRGLLAMIAALPYVRRLTPGQDGHAECKPDGGAWEIAPGVYVETRPISDLRLKPNQYRVTRFDNVPPVRWALDRYCPRATIVVGGGVLIVSPGDLA